jgi:hypothetical protein
MPSGSKSLLIPNANHLLVQHWLPGTAGPVKAWFRAHQAVPAQAQRD